MTRTDVEGAFSKVGLNGEWVSQSEAHRLPDGKGAYALVLKLDRPVTLDFSRGAQSVLPAGTFAYLGSARGPGGLRARLTRHFSSHKKMHWHVDRLTVKAHEMWALPVLDGHECSLVEHLLESREFGIAMPGFGSSDCARCKSHLLALKR